MTTSTFTPGRIGHPVTFGGVLRSEWIKLMSLRSTYWSLAAAFLLSVGVSALAAFAIGGLAQPEGAELTIPVGQIGATGLFLTQLVFGVLGAIAITGEYSTGMIRSTFTAVPTRTPALLAKAAVLFVIAFVVGLITLVASTAAGALVFSALGQSLSFAEFGTEIALPLLGGALYLALLTVFALAVGAMVRAGAGAIAIVLGILLVIPSVLAAIPVEWVQEAGRYMLSTAGMGLSNALAIDADFWRNLIVAVAWPVVALLGAVGVVLKRDA
jgi:ABC-2 type transport system permease protein